MRAAPWGAGLLLWTACAPITVSPMLLRMERGSPGREQAQVGLRTGPRASSAILPFSTSNTFRGDGNSFEASQWGVAYDTAFSRPLSDRTRLHFGGTAEFSYPLPLPGYGVYAGVSHWLQAGPLFAAPSVSVRGATDFGLAILGGPGSFLGLEAAATLGVQAHERLSLGFIPFLAVQRTWAGSGAVGVRRTENSLFFGGVFAVRLVLDDTSPAMEFSGGSGRMAFQGGKSFNAPLMGARVDTTPH